MFQHYSQGAVWALVTKHLEIESTLIIVGSAWSVLTFVALVLYGKNRQKYKLNIQDTLPQLKGYIPSS